MKTFNNGKKTRNMPPLLVNNNLISNFIEKANIFNNFLVRQCQPIANSSIFPSNQILYKQNSLRDFDTDCGKVLRLINILNPHKARVHDGTSIRMIKLCNLTKTKPLSIVY